MIIILYFAFCLCAGMIASAKNRSGIVYFLLSLCISPLLGIILAAAMPQRDKAVKKPIEHNTDWMYS